MTGVLLINLFKDQFKNSYVETGKKIIKRKIHQGKYDLEKSV